MRLGSQAQLASFGTLLLKISEINNKTGDGFAAKVINMLKDLQLSTAGVRFQYYNMTATI